MIYASLAIDGHIVTTCENAPGQVEVSHHEVDGRQAHSMISSLYLTDEQTNEKKARRGSLWRIPGS
jgi:hypothetical protein